MMFRRIGIAFIAVAPLLPLTLTARREDLVPRLVHRAGHHPRAHLQNRKAAIRPNHPLQISPRLHPFRTGRRPLSEERQKSSAVPCSTRVHEGNRFMRKGDEDTRRSYRLARMRERSIEFAALESGDL